MLGGGLIVFVFSSFVPAGQFAVLMCILLLAAVIGDLILLPAILAGPLGKAFTAPHPSTTGKAALAGPG